MNIDQFRITAQRAAKKLSLACVAIVIPWLVVVMVLLPHYKSEFPFVIGLLIGTIAASCLFVPLWLVSRALARKHGLTCPRCGYWFIGANADEVLRKRQCPKCKQEVFDAAQRSDEPNVASSRQLS